MFKLNKARTYLMFFEILTTQSTFIGAHTPDKQPNTSASISIQILPKVWICSWLGTCAIGMAELSQKNGLQEKCIDKETAHILRAEGLASPDSPCHITNLYAKIARFSG